MFSPDSFGLLADSQIRDLSLYHGMISPFEENKSTNNGGPSYGLSSCGYDIRMGNKVLTQNGGLVDTHKLNEAKYSDYPLEDGALALLPGQFVLAHSIETFKIPDDIFGICFGKSTLVRIGVDVHVTPLEPGWEGVLTLEIRNSGKALVILHEGDGICQICFWRMMVTPVHNYVNRGGKYMNQIGVVPAR